MKQTYQGGCHCGAVRFEADIDLSQGTGRCNCSFCSKVRNWSVIVKPEAFRLLKGEDALSDYQFATKSGHHLFCRHCGVRSFGQGYVEQIGGAFVSISVMALDGVAPEQLAALPIQFMDGLHDNWFNPPAVTAHM